MSRFRTSLKTRHVLDSFTAFSGYDERNGRMHVGYVGRRRSMLRERLHERSLRTHALPCAKGPAFKLLSNSKLGSEQIRRQGFSLVEVLLALAITGIGLFVMIETASRCLAVIRKSAHYERARHLLARVELEFPLQTKEEIEEGVESERFDGEDSEYRWEREIKIVGEEEDGLFEVTTRVIWSGRTREAREEIVTYLYAPEDRLFEASF